MASTTLTATVYNLWNNNFDGTTNAASSYLGMYFRSNGYVYELLLDFDVSSLAGATITSASLRFTVTGAAGGTTSQTVYLMEQNKTAPGSWSSPPVYDDFGNFPGTHEYWDTELSNVGSVLSNQEYTINDSSDNIKDLVQSWIDDDNDNWGMVLTRNDNSTSRYVTVNGSQIYLDLEYTTGPPEITKIAYSTAGTSVFNVPDGVTSVIVKAWGAGGGGAAGGTQSVGGAGGGGGYVQGTVSVTPGEQLNIHVGGKGGAGTYPGNFSGGGGGGAGRSSVYRGATPLFIAGGGGGGGGGDNSSATAGGAGGSGGGSTGDAGSASGTAGGGGGGTQTQGGAGGTGGANSGQRGWAPAALDLGNCLNFDGDPECVNLGNDSAFNFTNSFTLECWVKPDAIGSAMRAIGSRSDNTLNGVSFGINASGNIFFTTFGKQDFTSTAAISAGVWTHIAVVFTSGNDARFYKNGIFIDQVNGSQAATTSGIDMHIAQIGDDTAQYWEGKIDEVRMWDDVRTDVEIKDNYAREVSDSAANLVGYWKLDEGSGSTTDDETTSGNDGTLISMESDDWIVPSDWETPDESGAGGDGGDGRNDGTTKGNEDNGGITNGGDGGGGNMGANPGFAGGGGGGSGYGGGGGGSCSASGNAGGGGGGGGSNYIDSGATSTTDSQGSGANPPNTTDDDYIASAGVGGSGGSTTSNGNDGNNGRIVIIWSGATFYYGMQFYADSSNYCSSVSAFTPPSNGSVATWMYLYENPGLSVQRVMGSENVWELLFGTDSPGTLSNDLNQGGGSLNSNTTFQALKPYHVVCTYDSDNTGQIFIDGVLDATGTGQTGSPGSATLELGHTTDATGQYFNGLLEDLRIYDRVLSENECATIYSCKGTDNITYGLLHRWTFTEGTIDTTTADTTGLIKDWGINSLNMTPVNNLTFKGTRLKYRRFV